MTDLPVEAWGVIAGVAALAVIGMLYVLAADVREQTRTHELKRQVHKLHGQYLARLSAMRARAKVLEELERGGSSPGIEGDYDLVDDPRERRAA